MLQSGTGRTRESGFVLITSLLVLVLLAGFGAGAFFLTNMNLRIAENTRTSAIAHYNAHEGLDVALLILAKEYYERGDGTWPTFEELVARTPPGAEYEFIGFELDPVNATAQRGVPGPASDRLPHFRAAHLPSAGAEIQCEYLVPRHSARLALRALARLAEPLAGLVQVCEVRSVAADTAWMSPAFAQPCVAVHFTLVRDVERVAAVLPVIDAALGTLGGRPHWGKAFHADPERVRALYPRRADFLDVLRSHDPQRTFSNAFVRRWVG